MVGTIASLLGLVCFFRLYNSDKDGKGFLLSIKQISSSKPNKDESGLLPGFNLDFFPRKFNTSKYGFDCEDLFSVGTAAETFRMSDAYMMHKAEFHAEIWKATKNNTIPMVGNTGDVESQYRALHYMGSSPNVKHICETGFNAGHSSFDFLTSNERATVHSFDLGNHFYARPMAKYLTSKFKSRLSVTFGNSVETIPKFSTSNPDFQCDVMFVDGDHSYNGVLADLRNFIPMAHRPGNLIIIDDYPTGWGHEVGKAWNEMIALGKIKELMKCSYRPKQRKKGFSVGTVMQ